MMQVVFTGQCPPIGREGRVFGRADITRLAAEAHFTVKGTVTAGVAYLVASRRDTQKAVRAQQVGVTILTYEQFVNLARVRIVMAQYGAEDSAIQMIRWETLDEGRAASLDSDVLDEALSRRARRGRLGIPLPQVAGGRMAGVVDRGRAPNHTPTPSVPGVREMNERVLDARRRRDEVRAASAPHSEGHANPNPDLETTRTTGIGVRPRRALDI